MTAGARIKLSGVSLDWARNPRVQWAAQLMRAGGVVAYPTEAVWGLGCDPDNPQAVARLLRLKGRSWRKGLILLGAEVSQLVPLVERLDSGLRARLEATWPGPVTWLVPATDRVPEWIRGRFDSVALRITDHPLAAGLSRAFGGPIVSTSANPQGMLPATSRLRLRHYFDQKLDAITPGSLGGRDRPSEIRDLLSQAQIRG